MKRLTAEELWEIVRTLDHAVEYLQNDAGERDVVWTEELNEACVMLNKARNLACKKAIKESL